MAKVSTKDIAKAIYASAKNQSGTELSNTLASAVAFLAKKNLLSKSPEILEHLQQIQDTELKVVRAKVISKNALTKNLAAEISRVLKKRYKADDVILDSQEDASLLGGVRIEAQDEVIDLSLKNKLNQLQTHLLTTNHHAT